ncbi:hypothetical protein [Brumimicrobium oceani]|nr:hypothetical protein [Brumimicrobium oceani]
MNYLIYAIFIIGFGLAMIYFNWMIAILILFVGIALLFTKSGVIFSADLKKFKSYKSFFGLTIGYSFQSSDFNKVKLKYTNETTNIFSQGVARDIRARTYDIVLTKSTNQKSTLHEFTEYKLAEKTFNIFVEKLGYEGVNKLAEIQSANLRKRKRGR